MAQLNFAFLKSSSLFSNQYKTANKILKLYEIEDYRDVMVNSRLLLEAIVKKIFTIENLDRYYPVHTGNRRTLRSDTFYLQSELHYPTSIINLFNEVRKFGNDAVHDEDYSISKGQAWRCICDINDIFVFLLNTYKEQKLYYMRPDIAMDAATHARDSFKKRTIKHPIKKTITSKSKNPEVQLAKQYLKQKKKSKFSTRLRKLLKK